MRSNKDRLSGFPGEYPGRPTGAPGVVHREKKKPVENSGCVLAVIPLPIQIGRGGTPQIGRPPQQNLEPIKKE